jgi:D-galactarolactone cycloisomerase
MTDDSLTIRSVETFGLSHRLEASGYGGSKVRVPTRSCTLVKVTTRDGVVGWGEAFGPPALTGPALDQLAAQVVGTPVSLRENRWLTELQVGYHQGMVGPRVAAMSGLDISMWDAVARTLGISISALLGGRARDSVTVYASTGYYRGHDELPYLEEQLADVVANGFRGAKIKIGGGADHDVERVALARSALGEAVALMIDYNGSGTVDSAIRSLAALTTFRPYWVEEPLPPEDATGWARLAALGVPIAGGEALATRYGFRDPISTARLDIVQPDVAKCGGLTEALAITHLASAWNRTVSPHCWGTGVSQAATLQLLASLTPPATGMLDRDELWFELDRGPNPLRDGVLRHPILAEAGTVTIPDGDGLGVEIDEDFVRAHATMVRLTEDDG